MNLTSFNAGYSAQEDRILLQVVGDNVLQSFWLTRRATFMLGQGIQKVLESHCAKFGAIGAPAEQIGEIVSFGHANAVAKNPTKPGKLVEDRQEKPILLYQMRYSADDAETCQINLTDAQGQGYGYRLTADMLHALLNLIQSQCNHAQWGIRLVQATPTAASTGLLH